MKAPYFLWPLLLTAISAATAQTHLVTGSVKDNKGNPIHFVFVNDNNYKEATFTDSLGNFSIAVHPDSKLGFVAKGYADTLINVGSNSNLQIMLREIGTGSSVAHASQASQTDPEDMRRQLQHANDADLRMMPGHEKGNLRGSRYLFDNFVHGYIISAENQIIYNPSYLVDYDKISGLPVLTNDNENISQFNWDRVSSFTLFSKADRRLSFVKEPSINNAHFLQMLASGKKYKIYKLIKTKFMKADYVNSGIVSHGNDYDEYVDDADYYVWDIQANKPQKFTLKKKSLKEGFPNEEDKVNKYVSDNKGSIDETYLSKLGDYMNQ